MAISVCIRKGEGGLVGFERGMPKKYNLKEGAFFI